MNFSKILTLILLCTVINSPAKTIRTAHGTWKLVWEDNFNGSKLSPSWEKIPRGVSEWCKFMTNHEDCFRMKGGKLTMLGITNTVLPNDTAHFLTGGVRTYKRKLFSRGRIEIRLKMDNAHGAWPAAWLLSQNDPWPKGGEIDIMERLNSDDFAYQTVHSPFTLYDKTVKDKPRSGFTGPINNGKYNIYGVELYKDSLCFFINDIYTGTYRRDARYGADQYPFDRPMYLLIDMQLGGNWVGAIDPSALPYEYTVDYVKFYKKETDSNF